MIMCGDVILVYNVSPADVPSITSNVSCKGVIPFYSASFCHQLQSMCPVRHKKKKERESEKELVPWSLGTSRLARTQIILGSSPSLTVRWLS